MEGVFAGFAGNVRRHTRNKCGVQWSGMDRAMISFVVDNFYFKKDVKKNNTTDRNYIKNRTRNKVVVCVMFKITNFG